MLGRILRASAQAFGVAPRRWRGRGDRPPPGRQRNVCRVFWILRHVEPDPSGSGGATQRDDQLEPPASCPARTKAQGSRIRCKAPSEMPPSIRRGRAEEKAPEAHLASGDASDVSIPATGQKPGPGKPGKGRNEPESAPKPTDPGGPQDRTGSWETSFTLARR